MTIRIPTRRSVLRTGLAAATLPFVSTLPRSASAAARPVTKVLDFQTSADVEKAEKEGSLLFYTHDGVAGASAAIAAFNQDFPKIKASYIRLQTGALFSRILSERSAGRYECDAIQFSDVGTAEDFRKKGGFDQYESPEYGAYDPKYITDASYFCSGMTFCGMAYNTDKVKAADAPKNWKDLLDARWMNITSCKQATSGMQFVQWYELRKLYGDGFWQQFAKLKPHGFDSRAQLFDRLAKGDDAMCGMAEWAAYVLYHERKAPIAFVAPPDGLPATQLATGVVNKAPHPEAGRLFVDWLASPRGQKVYQDNKDLLYGSVRKDAPAMPGGLRLTDFKLLIPSDLKDFLAQRDTFNKEWNAMLGLL